jgi:uridine phosphorylase
MGNGRSRTLCQNGRINCSWSEEIYCGWYCRNFDGQTPEDGVAHLYLKGETFAKADEKLFSIWNEFSKNHSVPSFHTAGTWSFSAIFRETPADVVRVTKQGYDVVEMEAATLYAIGQEKGVQALSLFVISDAITQEAWTPHIKEPRVRNNLHKLSEWALEFCKNEAKK